MKARILVVEDEEDLAQTLIFNLEREGYTCQTAGSGREAVALALGSTSPDLLILDLMLPDGSGLDVCRKLRAEARTQSLPILMLTALDTEVDRVVGFEVGADDYVTKPFSVRELILRVRALLRRTESPSTELRTVGDIAIHLDAHRVDVGGEPVSLTALEFRLLCTLAERKDRVQSRETLLRDVWDMDPSVNTRTVDTHIKRLRQKLGPAGGQVETVRGIGYCLRGRSDS